MRRLILPGTVLTLVIASLALAEGCGGSHARDAPAGAATLWDFGRMAGYASQRRVDAIGASWTVPSVREGSQNGEAGDWIGAQGPFGNGAFIQVGTIAMQSGRRDRPENQQYIAFWSDRAHHFKPVFLFQVTPLTTVTASLRHQRGRWLVSIRDGSHLARFATSQEGSSTFRLAMWLAEHPGEPGQSSPYPVLTPARFSGLRLNGARPAADELESQWMTAGHRHYGPTPVLGNSFEIVPVRLSRAGEHYLQLAAPIDRTSTRLDEQLSRIEERPSTKRAAALASDLRSEASAIGQFIQGLSSYPWPAASRRAVDALVTALRAERAEARAQLAAGAASRARWAREFMASPPATNPVPAVRKALGLPEARFAESDCRLSESNSEDCAP